MKMELIKGTCEQMSVRSSAAPMTDQRKNPPKFSLVNSLVYWGYLKECG